MRTVQYGEDSNISNVNSIQPSDHDKMQIIDCFKKTTGRFAPGRDRMHIPEYFPVLRSMKTDILRGGRET